MLYTSTWVDSLRDRERKAAVGNNREARLPRCKLPRCVTSIFVSHIQFMSALIIPSTIDRENRTEIETEGTLMRSFTVDQISRLYGKNTLMETSVDARDACLYSTSMVLPLVGMEKRREGSFVLCEYVTCKRERLRVYLVSYLLDSSVLKDDRETAHKQPTHSTRRFHFRHSLECTH